MRRDRMENITLIGEAVRIQGSQVDDETRIANGRTVNDATRVYLILLGSQNENSTYEKVTQMRLRDINELHDEDTNPYDVVVGSFYITVDSPIIVQKRASDKLIRSWTNNELYGTPVFDRD